MPTIYQVAERAGVSLSTVSRVLNGKQTVNHNLRIRVEQAISELNYKPNLSARSLAKNKTDSVGAIVPSNSSASSAKLLNAIITHLRAENKHVIVTTTIDTEESEKSAVEFLVSRNCDAILMYSEMLSDNYLTELHKTKVPLVLINRQITEICEQGCTIDNERAGYCATRHLLENGHQNIAFLSGQKHNNSVIRQLAGYEKALKEAGLVISSSLMKEGDFSAEAGYSGLLDLLACDVGFSAVICSNDVIASGVLRCARELGMNLPSDFSVMCINDTGLANHLYPRLTSVDTYIDDTANWACSHIMNSVYGQYNNVQYGSELTIEMRDSTVPYMP